MYMWSDDGMTMIIHVDDVGNVREVLRGSVEYEDALNSQPMKSSPISASNIPPPSNDELAAIARQKRDGLLAESDWTQLPDVSDEISVAWQPYRQALRDITDQQGFPVTINWPSKPGA